MAYLFTDILLHYLDSCYTLRAIITSSSTSQSSRESEENYRYQTCYRTVYNSWLGNLSSSRHSTVTSTKLVRWRVHYKLLTTIPTNCRWRVSHESLKVVEYSCASLLKSYEILERSEVSFVGSKEIKAPSLVLHSDYEEIFDTVESEC